ncbi:MAG: PorT family protein, partial [Treponema sp.]|nr:PorT family protein [Treponema sp.]
MAVMAFLGDDLSVSSQLRGVVIQEVEGLEGYTPRQISSDEFPEILEFRPDEPPDPKYPGSMPYVLTGEFYFDTEDLQHFQLWLWNSANGSLVYTDELVAEDTEEAESYLPALVAWVFSQIPKPVEVVVDIQGMLEEAMAEKNQGDGEIETFPHLYLGGRLGGAASAYYIRTTGNYDAGMTQGFGVEAAFMAEYRPWRFLSVQAEAAFALDSFKAFKVERRGLEEIHTTTQYTSFSILFPLLVKFSIDSGPFNVSIAAGPYLVLPLGQAVTEGSSYAYRLDLPLGLMAGMELGHALGPGELILSLRYGRDFGITMVGSGLQYTPTRVVLSAGYRFGFLKKKKNEAKSPTSTGTETSPEA